MVCARPLQASTLPPGFRCAPCREHPPGFDRLLALWSYEPPLHGVIQGLKFGRLDYLGRHLAEAIAETLGEELAGFDAVVAVPLHWRRRLTRGYNQAERIARPLAGSGAPSPLRPSPAAALHRRRAASAARTGSRTSVAPSGFPVLGRSAACACSWWTTSPRPAPRSTPPRPALKTAGAAAVAAVAAGRTPLLSSGGLPAPG